MRVGLVGGGYWGAKHLRVLHSLPEADSVVLIDTDRARRVDLAASYPGVTTRSNLDDAIAQVDAVVIATPAGTHTALGLQALRAGKHVLVEKPMALSTAGADSMIAEARERSLTLMVGHTFVFNPAVTDLKRRIAAGELGTIQHIRSSRLNLGLHQGDVNVIWDLAPHDISIINHLLDETPVSVAAWGLSAGGTGVEDIASLRLRYQRSDLEAHVQLSWLDPTKVRQVTVIGSRRMATFDDLNSEERLRLFDRGLNPPPTGAHGLPLSYRFGTISSPHIEFDEPLVLELRAFLQSVASGEDHDGADGRAGRDVVAVLEAAERSLITGRHESPATSALGDASIRL